MVSSKQPKLVLTQELSFSRSVGRRYGYATGVHARQVRQDIGHDPLVIQKYAGEVALSSINSSDGIHNGHE